MCIHPLDPVGKNIRCCHLHRGGKVDDHRIFFRCSPRLLYCRTDFQRKLQLGSGKTLRRIFQHDLTGKLLRTLFHHLRSFYGNIYDLLFVHAKHHIPLQRGRRIINMHDSLFAALNGFKSTIDQFLTALCQYLYQHIVRYQFSVHKLPQKIVLNLACRRKTNLDLLKSHFHEVLKHLDLFRYDHRINQRLIAVPQIHGTPDRCLFNLKIRPLSLRVIHHRIFLITLVI